MSENREKPSDQRDMPIGWLERIVKKRYGIAMLVALSVWPLLGFCPWLEALVVNGLLLDTYYQLAFLTVTNVVAFFFSISILRLLNSRNSGGRWLQRLAGDGSDPWGKQRMFWVAFCSMVAPLIVVSCFGSEFATSPAVHFLWSVLTIASSVVVGLAGLWWLGWTKCQLFGSDEETANYFPFESRSTTGFKSLALTSTWLERRLAWSGVRRIDFQFLIYLILLAIAHHQFARRLEGDDYWLTSAPSMLVLLIWLAFMALAGVANLLDQWRLPAVPIVVLVLAVLLAVRGSTRTLNSLVDRSDNTFVARIAQIREREDALLDNKGLMEQRRELIAAETAPLEADAWQAITSRMEGLEKYDNGKGKTLVVVTCPGGGIHAAAWAACVLDQLSTEYAEFKDSVCVISAVSGGSVGTLMFVSNRYQHELLGRKLVGTARPTAEEVHRELMEKSPALELAARSSLESIAFGTTVDDLYSLIGIPGAGRGQRLEDSFASRLPEELRALTMGDWGDRAVDGSVPIVIFNSTDAVTGRRILFDTIPTPRRTSSVGLTARPLDYRELMEAGTECFDVRPTTAARTSATFPYISPFTRPARASSLGKHVAMCDGGYVDNEGIVTAISWVEFLLKHWEVDWSTPKTFDRVLLLRIEPSASEDRNQLPYSGGLAGWFRWLIGPMETMLKVRSASQLERGNLESDLVAWNLNRAEPHSSSSPEVPLGIAKGMIASEEVQSNNIVDIPAFDKRRQPPQEIRESWEKMLKEFERDSTKQRIDPPLLEATVGGRPENARSGVAVVVQTIRFVDAEQVIPLNWKLSNKQKQGYLLAWRLCSDSGTGLRKTMDRYFTRTHNEP